MQRDNWEISKNLTLMLEEKICHADLEHGQFCEARPQRTTKKQITGLIIGVPGRRDCHRQTRWFHYMEGVARLLGWKLQIQSLELL